jgi:carboxyl-terminal processing protease
MNRFFNRRFFALFALLAAAHLPLPAAMLPLDDATAAKVGRETRAVAYCLEEAHYLQKRLSDMDQNDLLRTYMGDLDPTHLFFLETDVKGFQDKYAPTLAYNIRELGNIDAAYAIFDQFQDRVAERIAWINQQLNGTIDLEGNDTYRPDRTDLPWPATAQDANVLWSKQLRFDLINELLDEETHVDTVADKKALLAGLRRTGEETHVDTVADKKAAASTSTQTAGAPTAATPTSGNTTTASATVTPAKPKTHAELVADAKDAIRKRYNTLLKDIQEAEPLDVEEAFLNSVTHEYDPHSDFLSESSLEDFDISMRNSLVGIGAMLSDKDGYCTIHELVPNGPAEKSGQLHPGDKIIGVGQAEGDVVDVIGAKLRKTVNMIRGTAGTQVRLQIVPADDPGGKKTVMLTREEIKLTTNLAKAQIIEVPVGDQKTVPVGVIDLPTFYGKGGDSDNFSTSEDVRELLGKLKAAGVQGIVLDMRLNGGGFLNEAIDMAGLFVPTGTPVLQVRSMTNHLDQLSDKDVQLAWNGPLLLLVSKYSASATEILTGALQDYHRALVVGDHTTHGKGTVQALYNFSDYDPMVKGAAKVTIQKWYLPDGNSIQIKGVASDIVLPSTVDYLPVGEGDVKHALVWDSVQPLPLTLTGDGAWRDSLVDGNLVTDLRGDSLTRQQSLPEFSLLKDEIKWEKAREEQKDYSLNYDFRLEQRRADVAYRDQLKARLDTLSGGNYKSSDVLLDAAIKNEEKDKTAATIDADKASAPSLDGSDDDDDADATPKFDIQLRESLRIMGDWIRAEENHGLDSTKVPLVATDAKNAATPAPTLGSATAAPAGPASSTSAQPAATQ